jgi:hypothetical protein
MTRKSMGAENCTLAALVTCMTSPDRGSTSSPVLKLVFGANTDLPCGEHRCTSVPG